ncbi:hypothetical protein CALVIDRAFT_195466 [Calocera viscosa TUFC12733]|uniref:Uncharacterized protein n=1 Tax=Calocera viscosa (strain TUFC12733) TaxID=1330018 RepID=A0A167KG69_CALVF|nr:hypothetical protein CALVIDRAFT_195466 [Calocera viscosa TUFC12733]
MCTSHHPSNIVEHPLLSTMPDISQLEPFALYVIVSRWTMDLWEEAIQWDIAHYNPAVGLRLFREREDEGGGWQFRLDFDPDDDDMDHMGRAVVIMKIGVPDLHWPSRLSFRIQHVKENWRDGTRPFMDGFLFREAFAVAHDKDMVRLVLTLYMKNYMLARLRLEQAVTLAIQEDRQPPVCAWIDAVDW